MSTQWLTTMKPSFPAEWLALSPKESHQILEKISLLTQNPLPDAKVKKQLKYLNGKLHRLRSGNYRVFYTFEQPYISLLALRRRDDDTYDEDMDAEFLRGLDPHFDEKQVAPSVQPDWEQIFAPKKRALPEPITKDLLTNLRIPEICHVRLLPIQTREDLLDCPGIPDEYLLQIEEYMFKRPLVEVLQQPDFLLNNVNDLLRYKEGELLGFLLKLSPEQEKHVTWKSDAKGPTLLKGGPGTGKSTIALYRVHSLVQELRKKGHDEFRILFTTYTNALVKSSQQLLEQLLGDDVSYVEVQTADKIVLTLLEQMGIKPKIIDQGEALNLLKQVIDVTQFEGNAVQQQGQKHSLERFSHNYLYQEINQVIIAHQINTLEEYLEVLRPGRKVRLSALQRKAIWTVCETFRRLLKQQGKETWHQVRATAEKYMAQGISRLSYDSVIIDEAQDLDLSLLRLLVGLCRNPNRIFITADANQSIYKSSFNWTDVHTSLRFQGRTSILHANYRSTREIGEAAQSYLAGETLDKEEIERAYVNSGPLPAIRAVQTETEEIQILSRFLLASARELRFAIGSCAVLCPTIKAGKTIAADLSQQGIEASFMSGQDLNLSGSGVKVLTLNSAKGLEFPIVALSGFLYSGWYGSVPVYIGAEEREESLAMDRRAMFVGMTRAMRALLLTVPAQTKSPLLLDFDELYWNLK